MKSLLSVLYVVFSAHYVNSQVSLVESGPSIVKPAQALDVTCTVTGASLTDSSKLYSVEWARQFPGKGLEWMGRIINNGDLYYAQFLKGRITITRDTSKGKVYLKLNNVNADDSGIYYCSIAGATWAFDIWGPGTQVAVTSVDILTPQVFPLIASGQEGNSHITMACMAQKYFPTPVTVKWSTTSGEILSGEKNIEFPLSGDPLSYTLVTQMTVSSSEWKSNSYSCVIKHNSSSIQKVIPKVCGPPPDITVQILQGSCFNNTSNQVELSCQAYNLASQDATIKWFINEEERPLTQSVRRLGKSEENLYGLQSTVNIFQGEWNNGARIICQVTDTKTGKSINASARKCSDSTNCLGIEVTMVPPTIEELYVHETARITCVAYNLKQSTGYSFNFDYPGAPATKNIQTEDPQLNESGIYIVSSVLTVSPETWQSNTEFTCTFEHTRLPNPIIRTISKKTETTLIAPSVAVFPPPPEDIARNELCNLLCTANGFYPVQNYMGWTENEMVVFKDQYVNSEPKRNNGNQSFFASSLLSIPCDHWKEGKSYSCVFGHEGIAQKFIRRPIDKYSGKPAKVNVSLTMSDTTMSCM